MTAEELNAIRARAEAATPGPWRQGTHAPHAVYREGENQGHIAAAGPMARGTLADVAFIAHARTDIPALLAHVDTLRAVVTDEERTKLIGYVAFELAAKHCPKMIAAGRQGHPGYVRYMHDAELAVDTMLRRLVELRSTGDREGVRG
jgi:hypothetical protein